MKTKKHPPQITSIEDISHDFNTSDWQEVEKEKKYYDLIIALKDLRREKGLTQKQLADKARIPRETIVKVESGRRNTTLETLMILAQAMGRELVVSLR